MQANKYRPLSRPLFIYAKRSSFKRPVVAGFIGYIFNNEKAIAKQSGFIAAHRPPAEEGPLPVHAGAEGEQQ